MKTIRLLLCLAISIAVASCGSSEARLESVAQKIQNGTDLTDADVEVMIDYYTHIIDKSVKMAKKGDYEKAAQFMVDETEKGYVTLFEDELGSDLLEKLALSITLGSKIDKKDLVKEYRDNHGYGEQMNFFDDFDMEEEEEEEFIYDDEYFDCYGGEDYDEDMITEINIVEDSDIATNAMNILRQINDEDVYDDEEVVEDDGINVVRQSHTEYIYDDIEICEVHNDNTDSGDRVFQAVEQMPQFPGGDAALMKWISKQIIYPTEAAENGIQGQVVVKFVVKRDGSIGDVVIVRSKDPALDREAVRVVRSLPNFTPGRNNGQPVNVWFTLPVRFKLQSE